MRSHSSKTVLHLPDWRSQNPYLSLLASGLTKAGWQSEFGNYEGGLMPIQNMLRYRSNPTVVHMHWLKPYFPHLFWSDNSTLAFIKCLFLGLDVVLARLRGIRIIWTWHNLVCHESAAPDREIWARRILALTVSGLVFHSASAQRRVEDVLGWKVGKKSAVIPHGHYFGVYPESTQIEERLRASFGIVSTDLIVMFFGALRDYKGIDKFLSAFRRTTNRRIKVVIAGQPANRRLEDELTDIARADARIRLRLQFIPVDEVAPLFRIADAIVLPFENTLSSGSFVLALSFGKPLLLSSEARVLDIIDESGAFFYSHTADLVALLNDLHESQLRGMGEQNQRAVARLDWPSIALSLTEMYGDDKGKNR